MHGQQYLGFDVADLSAIHNEGILSSLDRLEHPLTGKDRSIWLGGFAACPDAVASIIRKYVESPGARASLGRDAVPAVLLRSRAASSSGITTEEKRHARSLGRWVAALLLTVYGVFLMGVFIRAIENLTGAEPARSQTAIAVTVVLDAILGLVAVAHFVAAVAIVLKRGIGRKLGLGLSIVGISIGLLGVLIALASSPGIDPRPLVLSVIVTAAYSLSIAVLYVVGDLSQLRAPPAARDEIAGESV